MTDLETLRAALRECVDELQYVQRQHGKDAEMEGVIDRAMRALYPAGDGWLNGRPITDPEQARDAAFFVGAHWTPEEIERIKAQGPGGVEINRIGTAMMTPDAPETDAERWKRAWLHHITQADPLAASPAGQTIPGGVVDAIRRVSDSGLAERIKKLVDDPKRWNQPSGDAVSDAPAGAVLTVRVTGREVGDTPAPDFGSQVTEALAHGRGIDPGGQGMRVPTPAEKEVERARQAEYFRRNGVL